MKWLFLCALMLSPGILHAQTQWAVDSASVTFTIKNAGLPVHGTFGGLDAHIQFDPAQPGSSTLTASIDASTIDTGIRLRDKHLRKHDYFAVSDYPRIYMDCIRIEKAGSHRFEGLFRLKIKDISREVTLPFSFDAHNEGARLAGRFSVRRLDFELGTTSPILSDSALVSLQIDLSTVE